MKMMVKLDGSFILFDLREEMLLHALAQNVAMWRENRYDVRRKVYEKFLMDQDFPPSSPPKTFIQKKMAQSKVWALVTMALTSYPQLRIYLRAWGLKAIYIFIYRMDGFWGRDSGWVRDKVLPASPVLFSSIQCLTVYAEKKVVEVKVSLIKLIYLINLCGKRHSFFPHSPSEPLGVFFESFSRDILYCL